MMKEVRHGLGRCHLDDIEHTGRGAQEQAAPLGGTACSYILLSCECSDKGFRNVTPGNWQKQMGRVI